MRVVAAVALVVLAAFAGLLARDLQAHDRGAVARTVLGTESQLQLRDAIRRYPKSRRTLERLATAGDTRVASQANDLLALLDYRTRTTAGANRAVGELRTAIRLDPTNDTAKANLELVLRLLQAHGTRVGPAAAAGPRSQGSRGAGSSTRGGGY